MAEDQQNKEEAKFDFTAEGEVLGYISLEQARVVAMRTARAEPGNYGPAFSETRMVYQPVEQEAGEDYYIVTMSFRPEGDFVGAAGQEQFFIEKEGAVSYRQVLSLPRSTVKRRIPVVPVAIGMAVVLAAATGIALAAGILGPEQQKPTAAVSLPTNSPPSASAAPAADPGIRPSPVMRGQAMPAAASRVKFPGFDFQVTEGTFWEYKWQTETSSFCRDCPRGASKNEGSFRVSLGSPRVIQGVNLYQVRLSGEYLKKDGESLSFVPRWRYIAVNENKIVASDNGTTLAVLFDGEKGEWAGGSFFSSRSGTGTAMSARAGQIPDPISGWPDVRQGPVLAVGQSEQSGDCKYERLTGTTVCDNTRGKTSQSEMYRQGVGPVAYYYSSSFSSGSGITSYSSSSREYVGLTASSLLGDVVAAAPPPAAVSTTSALTTLSTLPPTPPGLVAPTPIPTTVPPAISAPVLRFALLHNWGSAGKGDGQFNSPESAAVDGAGNIYVGESSNARVQVFNSGGRFLRKWGSRGVGDGQFDRPFGIAVDGGGNVYIAEWGNSRVQVFDNDAGFLRKWGSFGSGDGQLNRPIGIALDAAGNVYLADSGNDRVQVFDASGRFLRKWGSKGAGDGQFNRPIGIALDEFANVYVTDSGNNRVQVFDSNGRFLRKWGSDGSDDGQFDTPGGLTVDRAGNVYVTDWASDRVQVFDRNGRFVAKWGSQGRSDGQFDFPDGIAVDGAGNVYVVDKGNRRVQVFAPVAAGAATIPTPIPTPVSSSLSR